METKVTKLPWMIGGVIASIAVTGGKDSKSGDDATKLTFTFDNGSRVEMYHEQGCCESVYLYDVCGELSDLIGKPLVQAEYVESHDDPDGLEKSVDRDGSSTWTFYKFATNNGSVTCRWFGTSNGYYSEAVTITGYRPDGTREFMDTLACDKSGKPIHPTKDST